MAEKETYKCLNPVGIRESVETYPLAPRLDTIDGKTIYISICGEGDTMIALEERLKRDYPDVDWQEKKTRGPSPREQLSDEEMKTCDALIQGIAY